MTDTDNELLGILRRIDTEDMFAYQVNNQPETLNCIRELMELGLVKKDVIYLKDVDILFARQSVYRLTIAGKRRIEELEAQQKSESTRIRRKVISYLLKWIERLFCFLLGIITILLSD